MACRELCPDCYISQSSGTTAPLTTRARQLKGVLCVDCMCLLAFAKKLEWGGGTIWSVSEWQQGNILTAGTPHPPCNHSSLPVLARPQISKLTYLWRVGKVCKDGEMCKNGVHLCLCLQGAFQVLWEPPVDAFRLANEFHSHIV